MQAANNMGFLWDIKFQTIFIFGFFIVVLYAKDKFNMPTYDREAMGPFASLPPQSLTIDTRYRRGRTVYLLLMLCLYTAVCLVGPITFGDPNISAGLAQATAAAGQFGAQMQLGPTFPIKDPTIWPVMAAAFLVGTGAASDNSLLGRIELFIRQYAHKTAYIPSVVSDLAYSLRTFDLKQWFIENRYVSEQDLQEREKALAKLVGPDAVKTLKENPNEGELAAWARANVLFYTLEKIFNRSQAAASARLESLTELADNREIRDRLTTTREELDKHVRARLAKPDEDNGGGLFGQVQRFAREVSLMIAVLLTQSARNAPHLADQLNRLGFEGVDLRDRSDHFVFTSLVNLSLLATAVGALVLCAFLWIWPWVVDVERDSWTKFSYEILPLVIIQFILYAGTFRVADYFRDKTLETFEWREDLSGYVILLLTVTPIATIICFILITLIFSIGVTLWLDFLGLVYQFLFQLCLTGLATAFALYHFRQAARTSRSRANLYRALINPSPWIHAVLAGGLTAGMTVLSYLHTNQVIPQKTYDNVFSQFQAGFSGQQNTAALVDKFNLVGNLVRSGSSSNLGNVKIHLEELCGLLNNYYRSEAQRVSLDPAPASNSTASTQRPDFMSQASSPNTSQATNDLFKPGGCDPSSVAIDWSSPLQVTLGTLSYTINGFYRSLESFKLETRHWLFPGLIGFLIAAGFGIGTRYARTWWLYNEIDQEDGQVLRLENELKQRYEKTIDFDKFLRSPIRLLFFLTPIEAVRYEDYRIKLFSKIKRGQLEIEQFPLEVLSQVSDPPIDTTLQSASSS